MQPTTQQILNAVRQVPGLAYDPGQISAYQAAGGTLTNGAIPTNFAPTSSPTVPITSVPSVGSTSTPVTSLSSSDVQDQIDTAGQTVVTQSQVPRGTQIDPNSLARDASGVPLTAPSDAYVIQDENGMSTGVYHSDSTGLNYSVAPNATLNPTDQANMDRITKLQASVDATFAQIMEGIKNQYKDLIEQQKKINAGAEAGMGSLLVRGGSFRNTSGIGLMAGLQSADLNKLSELANKEAQALAQAQDAYNTQNEKLLADSISIWKDVKKEMIDHANKIAEGLTEANKAATEALQKKEEAFTKAKNDLLVGLDTNTPSEVVDAVANAETLSDAVKAAGPYIRQAQGIVNEWQTNNRNRREMGLPDELFDVFQTRDFNRRAKLAAAANSAGLSNQGLIRVQAKASQFDNEVSVKNYQAAAEAGTFLQTLDDLGTSADNIGAIYAFAKIMDPNSVVREGEYKTVQDYSQALFEKFGLSAKRVIDNTNFLTSEAIQNMKDVVEKKVSASEKNYKNIYNEYVKQIDTILKLSGADTTQIKGSDFITDYSKGFSVTGNETNNKDLQTKNKIDTYVTSNPSLAEDIANLYATPDVTDSDVYDYMKLHPEVYKNFQ